MRGLLRILLRVGAALVLLLVVLYLLRGPLFARPLARFAGEQLSKALGGEFVLDRVEGSWFGSVELVGLRTVRVPAEGLLTRLEFERALVSYNPFGLLGERPQDAIHAIELSGARIEVDFKRYTPAEELEQASDPVDVEAILELLPARLPQVDIRGDIGVGLHVGDLRLSGLHLERGSDDHLRLRVARVELPGVVRPDHEGGLDLIVGRDPDRPLYLEMAEPLAGIRVEQAVLTSLASWDATIAMEAGRLRIAGSRGRLLVTIPALDLTRLPRWMHRQLPADFEWPRSGILEMRADLAMEEPIRGGLHLALRDLAWQRELGERLELDASFTETGAMIEAFDARLSTGTVAARGIALEFERPYLLSSLDSLDIDVPDLIAVTRSIPLDAETRRSLGELPRPLALHAKATSDDGFTISFQSIEVSGADTRAKLSGAVRLPERAEEWRATTLDLTLDASIGDLNRWGPGLPRVEGAVGVRGGLQGSLERPNASLKVTGTRLLVEGRRVESIDIDAALIWPALDVRTLLLKAEPGTIRASGAANLESRTISGASYSIEVTDLGELCAMIPGAPDLEGTLTGEGSARWDGEALTGHAALTGNSLVLEGRSLGILKLRSSAQGQTVQVQELRLDGPDFKASAKGRLDIGARTADIEKLSLSTASPPLSADLVAPLHLQWTDRGVEVHGLELNALGGTVAADLRYQEGLFGFVKVRGVDVGPLLEGRGVKGRVDCDVSLDGENFALEVGVSELRFDEYLGKLTLRARQDERGLVLEQLLLKAGGALELSGSGTLPLRLDREKGPSWIEVGGHPASFRIDGSVGKLERFLTGVSEGRAQFQLGGAPDGLTLQTRLEGVVLQGGVRLPSETALNLHGGTSGLELSVVSKPDGIGEVSGTVRSPIAVDWLDPESLRRAFREGEVKGLLRLDLPDLSFVAKLVEQVRHITGKAKLDVAVRGPIRAPVFSGTARFDGVNCTLDGVTPIQDAAGVIVISPHRVELQSLSGLMGYEPFEAAGTIDLKPGGPPVLDLRVEGRNLLLARERHLRARADLDISVTGPVDALSVRGRVRMTDALFSQPIDILAGGGARTADTSMQLFSIRDGPFARATLDIDVSGDEAFRIRNNFVRGAFTLRLHLGGTGAVPEPRGNIFFQETLVQLPATSLKVDQGDVSFPPDNPFAAKVNILAHTRMRGFDLDVRVAGIAPDLQIFVASNPSLNQTEAITLLTTGNLPEDYEDEKGQRAAMTRAGTFVGKQLLARALGPGDPDKESLFDRIDVETGREITTAGQETIEAEFRIRRPWFFRGERDRFDDYNFGLVWRIRFR